MTINQTIGQYELVTDESDGTQLVFRHETTGNEFTIDGSGSNMGLLDVGRMAVNNIEVITEVADLPDPSGGTHTLEDLTAYYFSGFITSDAGLELGLNTPLIGSHGATDGFIHTGGTTAIEGTDAGLFARNLYLHAPGGTVFDVSGDQTTEMLVESISVSDAAGLGRINSLGTIDGYRVPTFKGCNFEQFNAGFTFDGSPNKIFIANTPFRNIDRSGVTMLTLAGTCDVDIVDFAGNYIKDVQSDTEVWRIEAGAEPNEVFQYRGITHNATVTPSNALVGPNAAPTVEPFWVSNSHPVRESGVVGELSQDADTNQTVTIGAADTWTPIEGTTFLGNETERAQEQSAGVLEYLGSKNVNVNVSASISFAGGNGDIYRFAVAKGGTVEPASIMELEAGGQNAPLALPLTAVEDLTPNETVSLQVKNVSAANDATIFAYSFQFIN